MRTSQAPSAATWLLKFLTPRDMSEALIGDLLEEFMRGRSASWYWRQLLTAIIVSFAQELRRRWMAIGFAVLWTAVVLLFLRHFYTSSYIRPLFDPRGHRSHRTFIQWATGFAFPISVIYVATFALSVLSALETMAGLIGLGIYLLTTKSFVPRRLFGTVSITWLLFSLET
jgi:hypothetical protein